MLFDREVVDVVLEVTPGTRWSALRTHSSASTPGSTLLMLNVEVDCLVGPLLTEKAKEDGVVYSMA